MQLWLSGELFCFYIKPVPVTAPNWSMKLAKPSTRALFGGLLGLALSFLFAQFSSQALYEVYSTSTLFRTITGNSPNSLLLRLKQISWALFFCAGWWMFWRFDLSL